VAANLGLDPGLGSSPPNHPPHIGLQQGIGRQFAAASLYRTKQWFLPVLDDASGGDVLLQIPVQIVMRGHLVFLAALLMQPHPAPPPLHKEIFHLHRDRRSYAGEGVDHETNHCSIAQTGKESSVDRVDQDARLVHIQDRRFALSLGVLRPAYRMGRVHGEDLADYHPIEEHPQRSQPLFHRRLGTLPELILDEGRDVDRLDLGQILDAMHSAKRGEQPDRFHVRTAGVLVADVGAEEVPQPLLCLGLGGEDREQGGALHDRKRLCKARCHKARIAAQVHMAPGDYVQFTITAAAQAQSRRDLIVHSVLAALGVVLLLSVVLMNWRNLVLVLVNMPFALVGGVLAVFAGGGELSLGAMVGFVTLFGITLRNSIMLISHYEHLVDVEGMTWGYETAIYGASERLAPILMTALVTALGLLPLAIGSGAAGQEIEGPLAIVILGGLITSTALNLLVLPMLALRFGRFEKHSQA
jgi:hypothetical protein